MPPWYRKPEGIAVLSMAFLSACACSLAIPLGCVAADDGERSVHSVLLRNVPSNPPQAIAASLQQTLGFDLRPGVRLCMLLVSAPL
jgi:hypothetical protein